MREIKVALGERSYPIWIGRHILDKLTDILRGRRGMAALCSDSNVAPLFAGAARAAIEAAGLGCALCVMPAGEEHKRLSRVEAFCDEFLKAGLDRSSIVIALGGGVPGDIAGFAASCFMRGIPFIQVPTSIMSQVDSSVGGKTGVNLTLGKNTMGAFHQPNAVCIDLELLWSLPDRELRSGLAEVVKHGVIADRSLFDYCETHAKALLAKDLEALRHPIETSCVIKAEIVSRDEREHGVRALLNYGHTFGHGIEAATQYGKFLHGEAVALGMQAAAALAQQLGRVDKDFVERQGACLQACGLPVRWPELPVNTVLAAMKHDKKACAGTLTFIIPTGMGAAAKRTDITDAMARSALEAIK